LNYLEGLSHCLHWGGHAACLALLAGCALHLLLLELHGEPKVLEVVLCNQGTAHNGVTIPSPTRHAAYRQRSSAASAKAFHFTSMLGSWVSSRVH
jgi:hypothetical protein